MGFMTLTKAGSEFKLWTFSFAHISLIDRSTVSDELIEERKVDGDRDVTLH